MLLVEGKENFRRLEPSNLKENLTPHHTLAMSNVQLYKSRIFVSTFHLIAVVQFWYSIYYHCYHLIVPDSIQLEMIKPGLGGRSRFLTYWCLVSCF